MADTVLSTPPTLTPAHPSWAMPPVKERPPKDKISTHMWGLRTDEDHDNFLKDNKQATVVIEYGSTWCQKCHEIFPTFFSLSKQYPSLKYAVAQVDYMKEAVKDIKYSPTFAVYRGGRKVDEVVGKDPLRLADHLWLHHDNDGA